MAELKEWEYIMKFEPQYLKKDDREMCFQVHPIQKLVRCKDCEWYLEEEDGYCAVWSDNGLSKTEYCSRGEERNK